MELNAYKQKLNLLFDKFTQKGFHLNIYYAQALVKYFECCPEKSAEKQLFETSFFSNLVIEALVNLEKISCNAIIIFLTKILTLLTENELRYCKLTKLEEFNVSLSKLNVLYEKITIPTFQLSFVKLLAAQISHNSGTMNIVKQKAWKHILTQNTHHTAVPVANAIYDFIGKLIWKLNEYEEETAVAEVLHFILNPIINSDYYTKNEIRLENEQLISERLISYLRAILAIFHDTQNYMESNNVIYLLKRNFLLRGHLHYIALVSRDEKILVLTFEIMFRFYFASYRESMIDNGKSDNDFLTEIMTTYINIINYLLQKNCLQVLLNFIVSCVIFWSEKKSAVPQLFEQNGQKFDICNQLILLLVVPMLTYASDCKNEKTYLNTFFLKLTAITTEQMVKTYHQFKEYIETYDIKKICLQGLNEVFKLKGHLNDAQAGIIYQALYYVLNSHVSMDASGGLIVGKSLESAEDFKILSFVLDLMLMLLKEHEINWYENFEIIYFQNTVMNILKQQFLPTKVSKQKRYRYVLFLLEVGTDEILVLNNNIVFNASESEDEFSLPYVSTFLLLQALSLLDWTIKKFLSPDLTLLVDIKNGSTIQEMGKEIRAYLTHEEWEVRDSALQIVLTCTQVSYIKYEPLQKLISEYDLLSVAASLALNDSECYVQASALRCLAAATKVENTWRDILARNPQLYVKLVDMLQNNQEGRLRADAANVLTGLYVNQNLPPTFVKYLYVLMRNAAIKDLYWEVQLSALHFWKHVIRTHLIDRGMIDGNFPTKTFSKDKRKIIVLNKMEITKQLMLMMNQLSANGCLTVLQYCLNDDCSVTVLENSYHITKDLISILDKFDTVFDKEVSYTTSQTQDYHEGTRHESTDFEIAEKLMSISPQNCDTDKRDTVIDEILAMSTVNLIKNINLNFDFINQTFEKKEPLMAMEANRVNPGEFITSFKEKDYLKIIDSKRNWNCNNLDTLLDEIIFGFSEKCIYETNQ